MTDTTAFSVSAVAAFVAESVTLSSCKNRRSAARASGRLHKICGRHKTKKMMLIPGFEPGTFSLQVRCTTTMQNELTHARRSQLSI
jgi:hypothetical protein